MEEQLLKEKKLRVTLFRKKVLSIFLRAENTLSLQDVEDSLGKHDRITLYRTLKAFTENGILHEIVMPGDVKKIALCPPVCKGGDGHHNHDHIHFKCKKCNEVFCIEQSHLPKIEVKGFKIETIEVQAQGICKNCI